MISTTVTPSPGRNIRPACYGASHGRARERIEEIEDAGLSQLNAVRSFLRLTLVHLLKLHCWPESASTGYWRGEIVSFQNDAAQRFAPSMRQRIDLNLLYDAAKDQISAATYDGRPALPFPPDCPLTLDQLLAERGNALAARLSAYRAGNKLTAPR